MTIKEVFDKAENGTLTWEQFAELTKDAKFVDLRDDGYVDKRKYEDAIGAKSKEVESLNDLIKQRDTDLASLQEQLANAGAGNEEKLASLNGELDKLKAKYEKDRKAYEDKLAGQAYEFAVKEYANETKFTSAAAKRDFIREMLAKKLPMENGQIMGADDFTIAYSEHNADAFLVESDEPPAPAPAPKTPAPQFVASSTGDGGGVKPTLTELMKAKNENPDLVIEF